MQILCFSFFLAAWTVVSASPLPADLQSSSAARASIIRYEYENDGSGNYRFGYETSDGNKRDETGTLVNAGQPDAHIAVVGSYSYLRPDGTFEVVNYSADENGFMTNLPISTDDLPPVQAPAPPAVVASLLG